MYPIDIEPIKGLNPGRVTPKRNVQTSEMTSRYRYRLNTNRINHSIDVDAVRWKDDDVKPKDKEKKYMVPG